MAKTNPPNRLVAIIECKCPRCRRGNLYSYGAYEKPFDLEAMLRMPETCSHCGFKYEIEPGFWWGAMYVAYALIVAILIISLIPFAYFWPPLWLYFISYLLTVFVLLPLIVRYSRVLLLQIFNLVPYDRNLYNAPPVKKTDSIHESNLSPSN